MAIQIPVQDEDGNRYVLVMEEIRVRAITEGLVTNLGPPRIFGSEWLDREGDNWRGRDTGKLYRRG
ncbi:hypothetical protein VPG91_11430 [Nitrospirillum amazonense]|uniref:hypothetical protein n=1 Tax=Nitrospirillum amazonense TaxID=28077 RepID=UPI002DD42C3E|nr:hypothetical protein [Nitrospirillum amazonense]MEC4591600.1 hypothetical protein [Nitrospirillum amazonense]